MSKKKRKPTEKQLQALARGRAKLCEKMKGGCCPAKKKPAAAKKKPAPAKKPAAAKRTAREIARELWDKLPSRNISLPQFKKLVNAIPFKYFYASRLATEDGENSVVLEVNSMGFGREVSLKLVRRTGWTGEKYSDVKTSNNKYLGIRVSNGFVNSPKMMEFIKEKGLKI